MRTYHNHPDMIVLYSRLDDLERGFQPISRDYQKPGRSIRGKIVSFVASFAIISIVVAQSGLLS